MFERYTEKAIEVVKLAQREARGLKHNYIGTEHLFLGLLAADEVSTARKVLEQLGFSLDEAREEVADVIGEGNEIVTGQIPFTPRAKKVLELSLREALSLGHNYIGTEHLLLGLLREDAGLAIEIIHKRVTTRDVRDAVIRVMSGPSRRTGGTYPGRLSELVDSSLALLPELKLSTEVEESINGDLSPADRMRVAAARMDSRDSAIIRFREAAAKWEKKS